MSTAPDPGPELNRMAVALERMNGAIATGFATVRGDINLLTRGEQANAARLDELENDVEELKKTRFPWPVITGICAVGALALSGFQMTGRA